MKRGESFWGACKAILWVLGQHFGRVRVDFAQPFSLKVLVFAVSFQEETTAVYVTLFAVVNVKYFVS